ncbi:ComF family protein [Rheinheimera sp. NSM]|uniref:ComF family protein n=1 Tax=Rheinheimera sp. NSM TaxID=3457884 RepID=UPI0040371F82
MLSALMRQLQQLWHLLLPTPCLWCSLPVQRFDRQLCTACQQTLPQLPLALCHYNLLWLPQVARGLTKPGFDELLSVCYYRQPYQHWLQRWKFARDYSAGDLLQQQFAAVLQQYQQYKHTLPQAIVYVPMHSRKLRQRGFNQAELLAGVAARQLQLPILPLLQRRQYHTAQVGLTRKQRQRNLKTAFSLPKTTMLPERIALVDDVVTTGATANEICRLLRRHGARHISLWTVAVTLFD